MTDTTADLLARFIAARLEEDEQIARAVADHRQRRGQFRWTQADPERQPGLIGDDCGGVVTFDQGHPNQWQAAHIVRHDPARVLREVEYGRWLLADHAERRSVQSLEGLRRYAERWVDHPDFDAACGRTSADERSDP